MAKLIERVQKPTLVISHNKTLAAQLHGEFKEFFPENAVEYFVSYYDYYQPEAYVASTDTYIEKDSDINAEIEKLRHSATAALSERRDVMHCCQRILYLRTGKSDGLRESGDISAAGHGKRPAGDCCENWWTFSIPETIWRWNGEIFSVRGDTVDIYPAGAENAVRIELFGDEVETIKEINPVTGEIVGIRNHVAIYPASHYVTSKDKDRSAPRRRSMKN